MTFCFWSSPSAPAEATHGPAAGTARAEARRIGRNRLREDMRCLLAVSAPAEGTVFENERLQGRYQPGARPHRLPSRWCTTSLLPPVTRLTTWSPISSEVYQ